jgi:hypothetical protein
MSLAGILVAMPIEWEHSGDGEFPYRVRILEREFTIRVNDFPAEPLYTIMVDGAELAHLEDWPGVWRRPPIPAHLLELVAGIQERRRAAGSDDPSPPQA